MNKLYYMTVILFASIIFTGCSDTVYICTGPQSEVYHNTKKCKGLRRCSGDIEAISIDEAKSLERRECKWCY